MEINTINAYRYLLVLLLIVSFVSPTLSLGVLDSISVSYWKSWHTKKFAMCRQGWLCITHDAASSLQTPSILSNRIPFQWLNLAAGSERSGTILFGWLKVLLRKRAFVRSVLGIRQFLLAEAEVDEGAGRAFDYIPADNSLHIPFAFQVLPPHPALTAPIKVTLKIKPATSVLSVSQRYGYGDMNGGGGV